MSDNVEFATFLSEHDWDTALAGWRCSAVGIPGASASLLVNGVKQDPERFAIMRSLRVIRWLGAADERPTLRDGSRPSVVAVVTLTKTLTPVSVPVIVALIGLAGTIGSAVITANLKARNVSEAGSIRAGYDSRDSGAGDVQAGAPVPRNADSWSARIKAAHGNELALSRLGELAYKDGDLVRAEKILKEADISRTSGSSDPYVPYRIAALYKLSRYEEASTVLDKLVLRVNHSGSQPRAEATIKALREVQDDVGPYVVDGAIRKLEGRLKTLASAE